MTNSQAQTAPISGHFTQYPTWAQVHEAMSIIGPRGNLRARYNIAPTTTVAAVRQGEQGREIVPMRWGLVPVWWKKPLKSVPATFNARAETVAEKPMFRDAFKKRRCIIPASGFYEWTGEKGDKRPHLFTASDDAPVLAIAGLWDRWRDPEGEEMLSCTMVVTEPSDWMGPYHDRMPVILDGKQIDAWLDGSAGTEILMPAESSHVTA
ncbi:SOS response-associated peptidase [Methylobacterium sp. C25]|uniref:SOS response-associated peptidase n=1 Tax=Methylobacterium sp. C25 TaxID=2721622 RepID=UPI001F17EB67|nr:SOS response-associated peptidase [Methylobacterium sp. C25]MCE4227002.1 SOS response-associated peptidase [Methylobacterium sp. C25]